MKQAIELYEDNESLFNDSRVKINDFVKNKRTRLFNDELEAEKHAKVNNTYHYDVYDDKGKSVGFGVPV